MQDSSVVLEGSAKALLYASLLVAIGGSTVRWLLLRKVPEELVAGRIGRIEESIALVLRRASSLALAITVLRVWTHTGAAFGFQGAWSWDNLWLIGFHSQWGRSWQIQVIAALVLQIASAATVWRRAFWPLATLATVCFTVTIPLLGHAAHDPARMALHVVHILAAGAWLGTLAVVLFMPLVPAMSGSMSPPLTSRLTRLLILRQFSPIALPSAAMVIAAGLAASWLYIGKLSNLWSTTYGHLLLLKGVLVLGISACGYINWRRLRKMDKDQVPSGSILCLEAALAVAVVVVTGFLTEVPHP